MPRRQWSCRGYPQRASDLLPARQSRTANTAQFRASLWPSRSTEAYCASSAGVGFGAWLCNKRGCQKSKPKIRRTLSPTRRLAGRWTCWLNPMPPAQSRHLVAFSPPFRILFLSQVHSCLFSNRALEDLTRVIKPLGGLHFVFIGRFQTLLISRHWLDLVKSHKFVFNYYEKISSFAIWKPLQRKNWNKEKLTNLEDRNALLLLFNFFFRRPPSPGFHFSVGFDSSLWLLFQMNTLDFRKDRCSVFPFWVAFSVDKANNKNKQWNETVNANTMQEKANALEFNAIVSKKAGTYDNGLLWSSADRSSSRIICLVSWLKPSHVVGCFDSFSLQFEVNVPFASKDKLERLAIRSPAWMCWWRNKMEMNWINKL